MCSASSLRSPDRSGQPASAVCRPGRRPRHSLVSLPRASASHAHSCLGRRTHDHRSHNRKRNNLEVWDASGTAVVQATIKGIEPPAPSEATTSASTGSVGTLVAGQSLQIRALGIPDDDSGNFFTLDEKSLCRWNLTTWHELTESASEVVKSFRQQKSPAAPNAGRLPAAIRRSPLAATLPNRQINSFGTPILTTLPLQPQDAAAAGQQEISARPATRLYSAEFSADGSRVLVGTGELDARVLDAATLKPIENISNRPDPLAGGGQTDGARSEFQEGHKSNIVALRFLPPNGDLLLTSENLGVISVWDTLADADGIGREKSRLLTNLGTGAFAVSTDGSLVLAGGATLEPVENSDPRLLYEALLWNTADLRTSVAPAPAKRLRVDQPEMIERFRKLAIEPAFQITSTAISRDNQFGAAGGRRGELVIWSLADGNVRRYRPAQQWRPGRCCGFPDRWEADHGRLRRSSHSLDGRCSHCNPQRPDALYRPADSAAGSDRRFVATRHLRPQSPQGRRTLDPVRLASRSPFSPPDSRPRRRRHGSQNTPGNTRAARYF
ncbi:MAG UNVERIFIED_CONTAM: hypothetical protein LVR18_16870 [Planctomycetaceae bacterium]